MGFDGSAGDPFEMARIVAQYQRELERTKRMNNLLEQQVRAFVVLQGVANSLSAELDLVSLLQRFTMAAIRLSAADVGAVYLADPAANALVMEAVETAQSAANSGIFNAPHLLQRSRSGDRETLPRQGRPRMPLGEGVAGHVGATGDSVLITDVATDARFPPEAVESDARMLGVTPTSLLVVPMIFRNQIGGVVQVATVGQSGSFDAQTLDFLLTLATQAGAAVANAQLYDRLRDERDRVIQAQEEERRRIARELHDGPAQKLAQMAMALEYAQKVAAHDPSTLPDELHNLQEQAVQTTREMRDLLFDLRPLSLEAGGGLLGAIQAFLDRFERSKRPQMHFHHDYRVAFPRNAEMTAFAVIQEAVNNVLKHAEAANCWIDVRSNEQVLMARIRDDGKGIAEGDSRRERERRGSWGMLGMQERADLVGGSLAVSSNAGSGTVITLEVPR